MHPPPAKLALSVHFGGIRRNPCTQSKRLITRTSRVQIPPPLLERPRKRGLSLLWFALQRPHFCPTFARRACRDEPRVILFDEQEPIVGSQRSAERDGVRGEPASAAARAEVALLGDEGAGRLVERAGRLRSRE